MLQHCLTRLLVTVAALTLIQGVARAQSNCPAANPDDGQPDDGAIQDCLNNNIGGTVVLDNGPNGGYYIISHSITVPSNTTLTSVGTYPALLKATPDLFEPIIRTDDGSSGWQLIRLWLYGDKYDRTRRGECAGYRIFGYNAYIRGSNFLIDSVWSEAAMCGSGMEVSGSGFEIRNSQFTYNGFPSGASEPWSDGLTVLNCYGGYVHDNSFTDNTDVNLIIGDGNGCTVTNNTISNTGVFAYAGLMFHNFDNTGDQSNSNYSGNGVSAGYNQLGYGIMVGPHPWSSSLVIQNPNVVNNSSSGAVVNLNVDGVYNGQVMGNSVSGAQGTHDPFCVNNGAPAADYTVGVAYGTALQDGYIQRYYHGDHTCTDVP